MKKIGFRMFICLVVIWVLLGVSSLESARLHHKGNNYGHVKSLLDDHFSQMAENGSFNGTVLIAKDGKIILKKGYGMANYEEHKINNPSIVFPISSMSKAFTVMSILMLEERGFLNVNDTIDQYIPEFPNGDLITIHHLLTHTSGLFLYLNDPSSKINEDNNRLKFHTPDQLMEYFMYEPLYFEPGTEWMYCNSGYILLGIIIERLSGMSYREFIKANILDPLGMKHTSYDQFASDFPKKKAVGYDDVTTYPPTLPPESYNWHPTIAYAAGGIISTIEDLYKWDQALYTNQLVAYETLEKMFTPITGYAYPYAYGWFISDLEYNGKKLKHIWHGGAIRGYHSNISRIVDEKITVIILENFTNPPFSDFYHFELFLITEDVVRIVLDNL